MALRIAEEDSEGCGVTTRIIEPQSGCVNKHGANKMSRPSTNPQIAFDLSRPVVKSGFLATGRGTQLGGVVHVVVVKPVAAPVPTGAAGHGDAQCQDAQRLKGDSHQ